MDVERDLWGRQGAAREEYRKKLTNQFKEENLPSDALGALYLSKNTNSKLVIENALNDKNSYVKLRAASLLIDLGEQTSPALVLEQIAMDENVNQYFRTNAISALAKLKNAKTTEILTKLTNDKNEYIRSKAKKKLAEMAGRK